MSNEILRAALGDHRPRPTVRVTTMFTVSCDSCQSGAIDGEYYDTFGEANDAAEFHKSLHRDKS